MSIDAMPGIQSAEISGGDSPPGSSDVIEIKDLKQKWERFKVIGHWVIVIFIGQGDEVSKFEQWQFSKFKVFSPDEWWKICRGQKQPTALTHDPTVATALVSTNLSQSSFPKRLGPENRYIRQKIYTPVI